MMRRTQLSYRVRLGATSLAGMLTWMAWTESASGQLVHGQRPEVTQGLDFLSWKISGDTSFTISQWYVPINLRTGLARGTELAIYSAAARSSANWKTADNTMTAMSDSKVQLSTALLDDQLLLSVGASIPTGRTKLTDGEKSLVEWLTSDFLNFPIKNPGEGVNWFGQVGCAVPWGQWVAGASGAIYTAGEYHPYKSMQKKYKPGSRLVGDIGIERSWPKRHHLAADLVVIYSTDDKVDGQAAFRNGLQIDTRIDGRYAVGRGSIEGGVRYIARGKARIPGTSETVLISEVNNRNGNDLRLHAGIRVPFTPGVSGWLAYDGKFLAANGYAKDSPFFEDAARLSGIGGGVDLRLGQHALLGLGARSWSGSADGSGILKLRTRADLKGLEVVQRLTLTL